MRACMVFKQGYMSTLQDAIGAGDDLDMGGSYVTCQLCIWHTQPGHMPSQNRAYGISKHAIWHPKTGHLASQNRPHGCTTGTPPWAVICTAEKLKSADTHLSR